MAEQGSASRTIQQGEVIALSVVVSLAVVLLPPPEVFGLPIYAVMRTIASEEVWGLFFLALSFLYAGVLVSGHLALRRLSMTLLGPLFAGLGTTFALSLPTTITGSFMLIFAAEALYTRIKLR